MNIAYIFKAILAAITALFVAVGVATQPVEPPVADSIATTTDAVVAQVVTHATTTTKDDVSQAYELGKAVGKLQATTDQIKSQSNNSMTSTANPSAEPVPTTATPPSSPMPSTGGPVPPSTSVTAPAPVSKARIEIVSPIAGKGLGRSYVAATEVADESNYIELGAVVYNADGNPVSNATVDIDAESSDKTLQSEQRGTGDVWNTYVNGQKTQLPVYSYHYEFGVVGQHVITFSTPDGLTASVSLTAK